MFLQHLKLLSLSLSFRALFLEASKTIVLANGTADSDRSLKPYNSFLSNLSQNVMQLQYILYSSHPSSVYPIFHLGTNVNALHSIRQELFIPDDWKCRSESIWYGCVRYIDGYKDEFLPRSYMDYNTRTLTVRIPLWCLGFDMRFCF